MKRLWESMEEKLAEESMIRMGKPAREDEEGKAIATTQTVTVEGYEEKKTRKRKESNELHRTDGMTVRGE